MGVLTKVAHGHHQLALGIPTASPLGRQGESVSGASTAEGTRADPTVLRPDQTRDEERDVALATCELSMICVFVTCDTLEKSQLEEFKNSEKFSCVITPCVIVFDLNTHNWSPPCPRRLHLQQRWLESPPKPDPHVHPRQ